MAPAPTKTTRLRQPFNIVRVPVQYLSTGGSRATSSKRLRLQPKMGGSNSVTLKVTYLKSLKVLVGDSGRHSKKFRLSCHIFKMFITSIKLFYFKGFIITQKVTCERHALSFNFRAVAIRTLQEGPA